MIYDYTTPPTEDLSAYRKRLEDGVSTICAKWTPAEQLCAYIHLHAMGWTLGGPTGYARGELTTLFRKQWERLQKP